MSRMSRKIIGDMLFKAQYNNSGMSITARLNPLPYTNAKEGDIILKNLFKGRDEILGKNNLCVCGSGKPFNECHNGLDSKSLIFLLWEKYLAFDTEVRRQIEHNNTKFYCATISCNDCCHDYFYVYAIEYFLLKHHILSTRGLDYFNSIVIKSKATLGTLKNNFSTEYDNLESPAKSIEAMFNDRIRNFEPCPLLNKDGLCDCYVARPLICRFFGTSSLYPICDKIKNCSESNEANSFIKKLLRRKFSKNDTLVEIAYDTGYQKNIDYMELGDGKVAFQRPYPLFYFFANDSLFEKRYQLALKSYDEYYKHL